MIKLISIVLLGAGALFAQYAAIPSTSYAALDAILNGKLALQTGTADPNASVAGTAGKDVYFRTSTTKWYACTVTGSPGTWVIWPVVAGDFPTLNQSTSGNAATATALQNARTIGGTSFNGTANITPAAVTIVDSTDATSFPLIVDSATGDLQPKTDAGLTYDASTGTLAATALASGASPPTISGGTAGAFAQAEGTAPTTFVASAVDGCYADSTAHAYLCSFNNAAASQMARYVDKLSVFGATTSAELAGVLSDETGTAGGFLRATTSSTVGQVLRVGSGPTIGFGAVDLADTDAVTGTLPAGNLPSASTSASGIAEAAIASEVTTGTDAARYVSPLALAGSTIFGVKVVEVEIFAPGVDASTGDGKAYYRIPAALNGMNLISVKANVYTAGTTGTINLDIARCAAAATGNVCSGTVSDVLSTNLTIDSGENSSSDAATAAVIDTANDDVATGQIYRFDIDAIHTTPSTGMIVELTFQLP